MIELAKQMMLCTKVKTVREYAFSCAAHATFLCRGEDGREYPRCQECAKAYPIERIRPLGATDK